jgi:phosphonate transport system substrate-binding protein
MLSRRLLLGSAASGLLAAPATLALAQAPRVAGMPAELVFAVIPAENAAGVTGRYNPFVEYLSRTLGTRVTLRVANDYAAVIEGQRSGSIHFAFYGPSAFARALMTGAPVEAFLIEVNEDGSKGYRSVLYVRREAPFQAVQDLRGRNLGLVDPNSTSGNNVPRFALHGMGIVPEQFFGRVVYTGSHENAIVALQQGTVDVAANWWNDERESNLLRMERKGMARAADFRIVFRSDQIVNSPMACLSALPQPVKAAIRDAMLALPQREPALFERLTDGKQRPWEPVDNAAYQPIVELNRFVDNLRRQRS